MYHFYSFCIYDIFWLSISPINSVDFLSFIYLSLSGSDHVHNNNSIRVRFSFHLNHFHWYIFVTSFSMFVPKTILVMHTLSLSPNGWSRPNSICFIWLLIYAHTHQVKWMKMPCNTYPLKVYKTHLRCLDCYNQVKILINKCELYYQHFILLIFGVMRWNLMKCVHTLNSGKYFGTKIWVSRMRVNKRRFKTRECVFVVSFLMRNFN